MKASRCCGPRKVQRDEALVRARLSGVSEEACAARFGITVGWAARLFEDWRRRRLAGLPCFIPFEAFDSAEVWTRERQAEADAVRPAHGRLFAKGGEDA